MPGHQRWSEANENSFESVDEFFQFPKGTAKELISMWGRGELFDGEEQSFKIPWKDLDHDDASSSSTAGAASTSSAKKRGGKKKGGKKKGGEFYTSLDINNAYSYRILTNIILV